jgi:hypothetical protein
MTENNPYKRMLELFLWLVALHSFLVGIALIVTPATVFVYFGYSTITEKFFPVQGGVFHIVLAIAYSMAARDVVHQQRMIMLAISAKIIATVFLFSYYFLIAPIWVVLLSGVIDGMMGSVLWYLFSRFVHGAEVIADKTAA